MHLESLYAQHTAILNQRHSEALAHCGFDRVLICAGAPAGTFLDDYHHPYRVNPHFKHWLPLLEHPHSILVVGQGDRPRLIYFQPKDYWHKPPEDPQGHWTGHFDIVLATSQEEVRAALPADLERTACIGEQPPLDLPSQQLNPPALINYLHYERAYKTDYESECLRRANRMSAAGHKAARAAFFAGGSELDIHHAYLRGAGVMECELPYANIVAMNHHGATLHYQGAERRALAEHEIHSLVIDAGADFQGYAADITRSYAYRGGEYAELAAALDMEQRALVDEIRLGNNFAELHWRAHWRIAGLLSRFEFVRLEPEAIVELGISSAFFPCGLGHFIGLQVHDVGGYLQARSGEQSARDPRAPFLRLARPIEPRQAFTIEPGIYFMELLLGELAASDKGRHVNWAKVDSFRHCGGVRVEDCVLVHEDRIENQSRDAFRAIAGGAA